MPNITTPSLSYLETADTFKKMALELMDQGKKIVVGYESMGIGGGEGYVTLMVKDKEKPGKKVTKHAL